MGLTVERDLDGGRGDGRVVGGTVEVDDEHLALDDADELIALGDRDNAWRSETAGFGGRFVGVVVALVSMERGGPSGKRDKGESRKSPAKNAGGGAEWQAHVRFSRISDGKGRACGPPRLC